MDAGVTFQAILNKATTTIDGGWRISFDVSQEDSSKVLELAQLRSQVLQLACVPIDGLESD